METKFMNLCKSVVNEAGFDLHKITWKNNELCFYIDKIGGINHNDCGAVTKIIEPIVENNDSELGENYSLSVSSIGIDGKDWE